MIGNINLYARLCGFEMWILYWFSAPGLFGMIAAFLGDVVLDFLDDRSGYFWVHRLACDRNHQPVSKALWICDVDLVQVSSTWIV